MRCHSVRWAHHVTSSRNIIWADGYGPMSGTALPLWWLIGRPEVLARRPDRLVVGGVERRHARARVGRRAAGRRRSARWPWPTRSRRTDASTSWSMIWAMPARRPGAWLQKSASQRLCACRPAQRSLEVAVGGARRLVHERAPWGRTAARCSGTRPRRRRRRPPSPAAGASELPVAVGVGAGVVVVGVLEVGGPAVEVVVVPRREERPVARRCSPRRGSRRRSRRSGQWWRPWSASLVGRSGVGERGASRSRSRGPPRWPGQRLPPIVSA